MHIAYPVTTDSGFSMAGVCFILYPSSAVLAGRPARQLLSVLGESALYLSLILLCVSVTDFGVPPNLVPTDVPTLFVMPVCRLSFPGESTSGSLMNCPPAATTRILLLTGNNPPVGTDCSSPGAPRVGCGLVIAYEPIALSCITSALNLVAAIMGRVSRPNESIP